MSLWIGETISSLGSQISVMALPLTAIIFFDANQMEMGFYQAMSTLPYLLFGLFAGALVDNNNKKKLIMYTNILSILLLLIIPIFLFWDIMTIYILYLLIFLLGFNSLLFELSFLSYIPNIVDNSNMVEANSKIQSTKALSKMIGPNIAGILINIFSAPFSLIINSVMFLVSSIFFLKIPNNEENNNKINVKSEMFKEIKYGLQIIFNNKVLSRLCISTSMINFLHTIFSAIFMLFLYKELKVDESFIGIVLSVGSIGSIIASFYSRKIATSIGIGYSINLSLFFITIGMLIFFLVSNNQIIPIYIVLLGQILFSFGNTMYLINQVTLRQVITPKEILGKINGSSRFVSRSTMPIAGILGGVISLKIGYINTFILLFIGYLFISIYLFTSKLKNIKNIKNIESVEIENEKIKRYYNKLKGVQLNDN